MAALNETQRKEIFKVCGDKSTTQEQVCDLFNGKYPDRPISRSTVQ